MRAAHPAASRQAVLLLAAWLGTCSQAQSAEDEARTLLRRTIEAAHTVSYEGTFVYSQGPVLEAMRIVHSADGNGGRQRLFSLNGAAREVVVEDKEVVCLLPEERVVISGRDCKRCNRSPFPVSLPRELSEIEDRYGYRVLGEDRTAGVDTVVVAIEPRDRYRYGYRLWLDRDTGVVLRSALMDAGGGVIEQLMFTDLQIKAEIDPGRLAPIDAKGASRQLGRDLGAEIVTDPEWRIEAVPEGFQEVMHERYRTRSGGRPTEHILLTDGLATVSVFIEALGGEPPVLEGSARMGPMSAYGRVIGGSQVLVVGEVPEATVSAIARSAARGG